MNNIVLVPSSSCGPETDMSIKPIFLVHLWTPPNSHVSLKSSLPAHFLYHWNGHPKCFSSIKHFLTSHLGPEHNQLLPPEPFTCPTIPHNTSGCQLLHSLSPVRCKASWASARPSPLWHQILVQGLRLVVSSGFVLPWPVSTWRGCGPCLVKGSIPHPPPQSSALSAALCFSAPKPPQNLLPLHCLAERLLVMVRCRRKNFPLV